MPWGIGGVYVDYTCLNAGAGAEKSGSFGHFRPKPEGCICAVLPSCVSSDKAPGMARQAGIIPLTGTLGGISFYHHKQYGYLARQKGGVNARRIREDEAFARSRENSAAFGRASQCGRVVRRALRAWLHGGDGSMVNRLTTAMLRALQADIHHSRGEQTVQDGAPEQLAGFAFDVDAPLTRFMSLPPTTWDGGSGELQVAVKPQGILFPTGATHVRLLTVVLAVDFEALTAATTVRDRMLMPLETETFAEVFVHPVDRTHASHALVVAGIEFYQEVSGKVVLLHDRRLGALQVAGVHALH